MVLANANGRLRYYWDRGFALCSRVINVKLGNNMRLFSQFSLILLDFSAFPVALKESEYLFNSHEILYTILCI